MKILGHFKKEKKVGAALIGSGQRAIFVLAQASMNEVGRFKGAFLSISK